MSGDTPVDDGFYHLVSKPFSVTTYQLAAALHHPCPLRRCASSSRHWEQCTRAVRLVDHARSLLERASEEQVVPKLSAQAQSSMEDSWGGRYMRGLWEEV